MLASVSRCVIAVLAAAGCNGPVVLHVDSDRPIPQALDAMCVGVADASLHGGQFGKVYRLEGALAKMPQSLRVEPGRASKAWVWVRGDQGGVPVVRAAHAMDFSGDVDLALDACQRGPSAMPAQRGDPAGPGGALLAASQGAGGSLVVAVAAGAAAVLDAQQGALVAGAAPAPPAGTPTAVIAADVDGDCDDDVIVATDGAPPELWRRDQATFTDVGPIGTTPAQAVAAADVDRDGDVDLVIASGSSLVLFRNDGSGTFAADTTGALAAPAMFGGATAAALGDLDGDGNPDLIVAERGGPLRAWLGDPGGTGSFMATSAIVPPVVLDVERLTLADADGDFDPDLAVAVRGAPMRLYVDRGGRLEDQSYVRLPQPAPVAHAVAFGGWDAGCEPDAVIAADGGTPTLHGGPGGTFTADAPAPAATDVVMVDLDDDGNLDAVLAGSDGARWLAR